MAIKQIQRGMQYRFKYIRLRIRLQLRHMVGHHKARNPVGATFDTTPPCTVTDWPDARPATLAAADKPASPLPTLRRSTGDKSAQ